MAPSVCINHFNDVGADEDHDHDEEDVRLLDDKIGADVDGKRREEEIAALSRADFVAENEAHTRPERPKMPEPRQRNEGGPTTRSSAHLHLNPRTKAARRSSLNGEGRETPLKSSKGDLLPAVLFGPALSDFREQLTASLDAVTLFRYAHVCRDWLEEARYDLDEKMSVLNLDIVSPLDCHVSRIGSILLSALRPVPGGEERALGAEKMVSWMRRASDMHHVQTQSWGALSPMRAVAAFLDELDGERNSSSCAADNTHEVSRVVAAIGTERCRAQSGRGEKRGQSGRGEKREQSGMGEKAGKVGGDMQSIADADPRGDEEVEGGGRMGQVMEAAAGFGRVLGARAQRNWREAAQGASTKVLDAIAAYIDEPGRSDGLASIAEGARLEQAQEADAGMRSREEDGERRGHEVDAAVEREVLVLDAAAVLARCELALHMLERERKEVAEAHEESAEGREVKGGEHNDGRNIGAAEGGAGGRAGEQRTKQKHKAGDRRLALAGIKCGHLMPLLAASNYDARQPEKPPLASFAKYLRDALPGLAILDLSLPSAPAGTSVGGWLTDTALADVLRELGDTVSVLDVSRQGNSARRSLCAGPNFVRALSHASALSELRAVGNATLQGEILEEAIRTCPGKDGIKVLDVRQCKGVDPAAVRSFGELKSLEEIGVHLADMSGPSTLRGAWGLAADPKAMCTALLDVTISQFRRLCAETDEARKKHTAMRAARRGARKYDAQACPGTIGSSDRSQADQLQHQLAHEATADQLQHQLAHEATAGVTHPYQECNPAVSLSAPLSARTHQETRPGAATASETKPVITAVTQTEPATLAPCDIVPNTLTTYDPTAQEGSRAALGGARVEIAQRGGECGVQEEGRGLEPSPMAAGGAPSASHRDGTALVAEDGARRATKTAYTRYKGVWKKDKKWAASVNVSGVKKSAGVYPTAEKAARAYDNAALTLIGPDAILNFLPDGSRNPESMPKPKVGASSHAKTPGEGRSKKRSAVRARSPTQAPASQAQPAGAEKWPSSPHIEGPLFVKDEDGPPMTRQAVRGKGISLAAQTGGGLRGVRRTRWGRYVAELQPGSGGGTQVLGFFPSISEASAAVERAAGRALKAPLTGTQGERGEKSARLPGAQGEWEQCGGGLRRERAREAWRGESKGRRRSLCVHISVSGVKGDGRSAWAPMKFHLGQAKRRERAADGKKGETGKRGTVEEGIEHLREELTKLEWETVGEVAQMTVVISFE